MCTSVAFCCPLRTANVLLLHSETEQVEIRVCVMHNDYIDSFECQRGDGILSSHSHVSLMSVYIFFSLSQGLVRCLTTCYLTFVVFEFTHVAEFRVPLCVRRKQWQAFFFSHLSSALNVGV